MANKTAAQVTSTAKGAVAIPAGKAGSYTVTGSSNGGKTLMGIPKSTTPTPPVNPASGSVNTAVNRYTNLNPVQNNGLNAAFTRYQNALSDPTKAPLYNASDAKSVGNAIAGGWKPSYVYNTPKPITNTDYNSQSSADILNATKKDTADYNAQLEALLRPKSQDEINAEEQSVRDKFWGEMQQRVNDVNALYAGQVSQEQLNATNRGNQTSAINALSGLRGSNIGQANQEMTTAKNTEAMNSLLAEKQGKINSVLDIYNTKIADELKSLRDLRANDRESWISRLSSLEKTQIADKKTKAAALRQDLIKTGTKWTDLTPEQQRQVADAAGYTDLGLMEHVYESDRNQYYKDTLASESLASAKLKNESMKTDLELKKEGYEYISTPAQRDKYVKAGRATEIINGRTYLVPLDKMKEYEQKKAIDLANSIKLKQTKGASSGNGSSNVSTTDVINESARALEASKQGHPEWGANSETYNDQYNAIVGNNLMTEKEFFTSFPPAVWLDNNTANKNFFNKADKYKGSSGSNINLNIDGISSYQTEQK